MATTPLPFGIDHQRHMELAGRHHHVWQRRVGVLFLAALAVLGLLNGFGQRSTAVTESSGVASLSVDSPNRVRGGLIFTSEFMISARQPLHQARLFLASGWFRGMTYNATVAPQPSRQSSVGPWVVLDFGPVPAGGSFPIWVSWQVDPTNIGRHPQDVRLYDGPRLLLILHRTITVFP